MGVVLELLWDFLAEVVFSFLIVGTGHAVWLLLPTRSKLGDEQAMWVGFVVWIAAIGSVLYWRLS